MSEVPWGVGGPLLAVVVAVDALLLVDLYRRDRVAGPPRVLWAVIIVAGSWPVGALVYWFVGRRPTTPATVPPAPPPPDDTVLPGAGPATGWDPTTPLALATVGLRKTYDVPAVDGVDLRVPRGATYGLIGPNGAGKTTLLALVAGLRRPTAGSVELAVDRRRIAVLPDTPEFEPWLTAREVVDHARRLVDPSLDVGRVDRALVEVGLADAADRRCGGFSRGMSQRLGLATCLVGDPELLLLDEPSSALDPAGRREVLDLIADLAGDRTVVLSTHVLADVQQVCDLVGVMQSGRLVFQGPIDDLLARTATAYRLRVGGDARPVVAALAATGWVREAELEGPGLIRLVTTDVVAAETEIAGLLERTGARLHAFGPAADLESAFLALTGARS